MQLIRKNNENLWDPFELFTDLQSDINRAFNRSLWSRDARGQTFIPSIEVHEESDHYVVQADLPGLKKEDFNIAIEGNRLTIRGERKQQREKKEKGATLSERVYGSFTRSMDFPTELSAEKTKAAYKEGVLEITLAKSEHAKPKQIQVEVK